MSDYRELSQQYAQGGIKAVILLNAGAGLAVLYNLTDFPPGLVGALVWSMGIWALGAMLGTLAWYAAFGATRSFDEYHQQGAADARHLAAGNRYQRAGVWSLLLSLACFGAGSFLLLWCYRDIAA